MLATAISGGAKTESIQLPTKIVIANETLSLEILKSEFNPNGKLIRVAIKNVSNKNIDWFRLSLGAALDVEVDFAFSDKPLLAPGEIYEDEYPFDSKSNEVTITVVSLLFVDKASEGDAQYAQLSREKRLGQRMELSRIVPLLREARNAPRSQHSDLLLDNLETEVSNTTSEGRIPSASSSPHTEARLIGIRAARGRVLNEIKSIQTSDERDKRTQLDKLEERYNSISSKLAAYEF